MAMWRVCAILVFLLVGWPISAVGSDATRVTSGLPDPVPCTGCWRPALRSTWQWHLDTTTLEPPFLDLRDLQGQINRPIVIAEAGLDMGTLGFDLKIHDSSHDDELGLLKQLSRSPGKPLGLEARREQAKRPNYCRHL